MKITREAASKIADIIFDRMIMSSRHSTSYVEAQLKEELKKELNLDIETLRYIVPILLDEIYLVKDKDHSDTYLLNFKEHETDICFFTSMKRLSSY